MKQQSMSSSSTPLRGNTPVLQDEILTRNKIIAYRSVLVSDTDLHCSPLCAHECANICLTPQIAHKERSEHRGFACRTKSFAFLPCDGIHVSIPPVTLALLFPSHRPFACLASSLSTHPIYIAAFNYRDEAMTRVGQVLLNNQSQILDGYDQESENQKRIEVFCLSDVYYVARFRAQRVARKMAL